MADRNLRIVMLLQAADKMTKPLRDMAAGSSKLGRALKEARDRLKALEQQQEDISSFRKFRAAQASAGEEISATRAKLRDLAAQMRDTDNPSKKLQRTYDQTRETLVRLKDQEGRHNVALGEISAKLKAAGINSEQLEHHEDQLARRMAATTRQIDEQSAALKRRNDRSAKIKAGREAFDSNVNKASASTAAGLGMIGTGAAIAAPLKMATQDAMDFQSVMADVKKVVNFDPGALGDQQFKQLGDDILRMSETIPVSAEGLGQIVAAAGRSGIARKDLAGFAEDAAKMSVAFDMSADDAGTMMAAWRTAFNTDRAGVTKLGDQINALTNAYGGNVASVNAVVTSIGPLGKVAGTAASQVAGMAQILAKLSVEPEVAATGIKNLMLTLTRGAATTPKASKAWAKLGLDAVDVAKRMQKDAGGTILDVFTRLSKMGDADRPALLTTLFGRESVGAIAPMLTNLDQLRTNFQMVGDASQYAGSMQKEYLSRLGTTANDVQLAQNNLKELGIVVGTQLLPTVTDLARRLSHGLQTLSAFARAHPVAIQLAAKLAATLAALMVAGGAFMFLRAGLLGFTAPFKFAFSLIAKESEGGGLALTKFGRLGARVFKGLPGAARTAWSGIASAGRIGAAGITAAGTKIWGATRTAFTATAAFASRTGVVLGNMAKAAALNIGKFAMAMARGAIALAANPMTWIILGIVAAVALLAGAGYLIYKNWGAISKFFSGLWTEIKADASGGIAGIARLLTDFSPMGLLYRGFAALMNWLGVSMPARLSDAGAMMIRGLINGITGMLGLLKSTIVNAASSAATWFKEKMGIHSPSRLFHGFGGYMMQGLSNGIHAGAGEPVARLQGLSRRIGTAMAIGAAVPTSAFASPSTGPQRGAAGMLGRAGDHYEIHIHPAKGMDEAALARLVAEEIAKHEAKKAAAKRSTFADTPDWEN
ncbi:phage tail tape measure protein [Sphingomonas oryzagri]|uniref:Phage tail tape measure protein n=1 Tax=Sphingomonas oryzagri TaxID=3042314 RepID=A0ABT6N7R0_9SPHN|nr:phage tail tape measure protein [Sphingomonas oryzagri]MDH7641162.1 phage tail tape measure protein [Sphingomonas oryzagri]